MLTFLLARGQADDNASTGETIGLGFCTESEAARRSESAATMSMNLSRIIFVGLVSSFGTWMLTDVSPTSEVFHVRSSAAH